MSDRTQAPTKLSIASNYRTASYRKLDGGVGMRLGFLYPCVAHVTEVGGFLFSPAQT